MPDEENADNGSPGQLGELRLSSDLDGVAARAAQEARVALESSSSLEAAYRAWDVTREALGALTRRAHEERQRLEAQGRFLAGSVRAALEGPTEDALLAGHLTREVEERLERARAQLDETFERERTALLEAESGARAQVQERVRRFASLAPPSLHLIHRPVGSGGQAFLHVTRPSPDAAVLLCAVLGGHAPTRHGFLFDEATEEVSLEPPALYPEEGVTDAERRPEARVLAARLLTFTGPLPVRGFIPVSVGDTLYRLRQRGPVLEVEVVDGSSFRSLLMREEGERLTGALLRMKLEGKLSLTLELST